jgi:ATP-dependent Clp protease protease subunit
MPRLAARRDALALLAGLAAPLTARGTARAQEPTPIPQVTAPELPPAPPAALPAPPAPAPPALAPPAPGTPAPIAPPPAAPAPAAHPAAPSAAARQAAPVPAIDRTKAYYVFFDQQIDAATMRALRRQLATLVEAGVSQITLVIDSPGGLVEQMLITYSFIRALPATIDTHAQGFVQSAGSALFLAGQRRSADRNARFLFHSSQGPISGMVGEKQLRDRLAAVASVDAAMAEIYRDRTGLTQSDIDSFARQDVIYTAQQALALGVVEEVADLRIPGGNTARILFQD